MENQSNFNPENNQMNREILPKEISLEDLFSLLKSSFSEVDNTIRRQAEDKLKSLESLIASEYIPTIINIVLDQNNQFNMMQNPNLRLSLILYTKNVLKNIFITKEYTIDQIKLILNSLMPLMISSIQLPDNLKSNISLLFIEVLNLHQLKVDNSPFINLLNQLNTINPQDLVQVSATLFIFNSISSSGLLSKDSDYFIQFVGTILTVIDSILVSMDSILSQISTLSNKDEINNYISIMKIKRQCFDLIFMKVTRLKKFNKFSGTISASIIDKFLIKVSSSIISKPSILFNSSLLDPSNLICMTTVPEYDNACNNMKVKATQIISLLLQFESSEIQNKLLYEQSNIIFKEIFHSILEIITKKLDYIKKMNCDKDCPDNGYESMIFQFGLFISRFIIREPTISSFKQDIEKYYFLN